MSLDPVFSLPHSAPATQRLSVCLSRSLGDRDLQGDPVTRQEQILSHTQNASQKGRTGIRQQGPGCTEHARCLATSQASPVIRSA